MGRTRRNLHTLASRARKKTSTRHLISSTTLWGHRLARVPASFTSIVRSEGKSTNARGYWSRAKAKRTRKRNSGSRGRRTPVRQRRRQPRRGQRDRRRNRTPKETSSTGPKTQNQLAEPKKTPASRRTAKQKNRRKDRNQMINRKKHRNPKINRKRHKYQKKQRKPKQSDTHKKDTLRSPRWGAFLPREFQ